MSSAPLGQSIHIIKIEFIACPSDFVIVNLHLERNKNNFYFDQLSLSLWMSKVFLKINKSQYNRKFAPKLYSLLRYNAALDKTVFARRTCATTFSFLLLNPDSRTGTIFLCRNVFLNSVSFCTHFNSKYNLTFPVRRLNFWRKKFSFLSRNQTVDRGFDKNSFRGEFKKYPPHASSVRSNVSRAQRYITRGNIGLCSSCHVVVRWVETSIWSFLNLLK